MLAGLLTDWLTDCLTGWLAEWLPGWLTATWPPSLVTSADPVTLAPPSSEAVWPASPETATWLPSLVTSADSAQSPKTATLLPASNELGCWTSFCLYFCCLAVLTGVTLALRSSTELRDNDSCTRCCPHDLKHV